NALPRQDRVPSYFYCDVRQDPNANRIPPSPPSISLAREWHNWAGSSVEDQRGRIGPMAETQKDEALNGDQPGRSPRESHSGQPERVTAKAGTSPADEQTSEVLQRFWQGVKRLPAYIR